MKYLNTYEKMISLDLDNDDQEELMLRALSDSKIKIIEGLLDNGFNPNHIESDLGEPILIHQIANGNKHLNIDIIKLLINKGADVNLIINESPLITDAIYLYNKNNKNEEYKNNYLEIIRLLIKSGANLLIKNEYNENTFDMIQKSIEYNHFSKKFAEKLLNIIKEEF